MLLFLGWLALSLSRRFWQPWNIIAYVNAVNAVLEDQVILVVQGDPRRLPRTGQAGRRAHRSIVVIDDEHLGQPAAEKAQVSVIHQGRTKAHGEAQLRPSHQGPPR